MIFEVKCGVIVGKKSNRQLGGVAGSKIVSLERLDRGPARSIFGGMGRSSGGEE